MNEDWRDLSLDIRAQIVAMEALRRGMADLPRAMVLNASDANRKEGQFAGRVQQMYAKPEAYDIRALRGGGGGGSAGGAGGGNIGAMGGLIGLFLGKFAAILAPLTALSTILSANVSGFNVLMTAVRVVATTFAPILLPVTAVVAAGLLAVSEMMWREMLPALEDWYRFVLANLIPAAIELADAFLQAADWIIDKARYLSDPAGAISEDLGISDNADETSSAIRDSIDAFRDRLQDMQSRDAGGSGGFQKAFGKGMDDVIKSLQMSMGPKAQMTGMADVWKNAQMAALNADPLEMRMLKISQDSLQMLQKIWNEQRAANQRQVGPAYGSRTGAGEFADDTGAGGSIEGDF